MPKLIQNFHILNGIKHTRWIRDNILDCRYFSDKASRADKSINTVKLLGRVGVEPERRGSAEHPVVTFIVATHMNYKSNTGEWSQRVYWHKIAVFKPQLRDKVMSYLSKGKRVLVCGKLSNGQITDREGMTRAVTTIIAEDVIFYR